MYVGWIKLYRQLLDKAIWKESSPQQKTILITLLLMAFHDENEWIWQSQEFKTKPGEFITSLQNIKKNAGKGISMQSVRTSLLKFERLDFLTNKSTKTGRLISICNWNTYQDDENKTNKDINKEVTKHQQRGNKEVTTTKNEKNDKNVKKRDIRKIYPEFESVNISEEEYNKLINKLGKEDTYKWIKSLYLHIGSKGDKYKSHYLTILNWIRREEEEQKKNEPKSQYKQL